jgi:hypothetical protein
VLTIKQLAPPIILGEILRNDGLNSNDIVYAALNSSQAIIHSSWVVCWPSGSRGGRS